MEFTNLCIFFSHCNSSSYTQCNFCRWIFILLYVRYWNKDCKIGFLQWLSRPLWNKAILNLRFLNFFKTCWSFVLTTHLLFKQLRQHSFAHEAIKSNFCPFSSLSTSSFFISLPSFLLSSFFFLLSFLNLILFFPSWSYNPFRAFPFAWLEFIEHQQDLIMLYRRLKLTVCTQHTVPLLHNVCFAIPNIVPAIYRIIFCVFYAFCMSDRFIIQGTFAFVMRIQ